MKPSAWWLLAIVAALLALTVMLAPRLRGEHDPRRHTGERAVVLYTAPGCAECEQVRARLRATGVSELRVVDAGSAEGYRALIALGLHQLPVVVIGQQVIGGFHPSAIDAALERAGYTLPPPTSDRGTAP